MKKKPNLKKTKNNELILRTKLIKENKRLTYQIHAMNRRIQLLEQILYKKIYSSKFYKIIKTYNSVHNFVMKIADLQKQNIRLRSKLTYLHNKHAHLHNTLYKKMLGSRAFIFWQYYNLIKRYILFTAKMKPSKLMKGFHIFFSEGPLSFYYKLNAQYKQLSQSLSINEQYNIWFKNNYPQGKHLQKLKKLSLNLHFKKTITLIMPTYNPDVSFIKQAVESVMNQVYDHWELIIVNDASTDMQIHTILEEFQKMDPRIKCIDMPKHVGISSATNEGINNAIGEYIGFIDHDDFLWPNALYEVAKVLHTYPEKKLIYSDEDKIDESGNHIDPFFKPNWSPLFLRTTNYVTHFVTIHKSLLQDIGLLREKYDGAQDWDMLLRATKYCKSEEIYHIPSILYSWRMSSNSTASSEKNRNKKIIHAQQKVLTDFLHGKASVHKTEFLGLWEVMYPIKKTPQVSIVIPSLNQFEHIKTCVESIFENTTYKNYEIVVVDGGSTDPEVLNLYDKYNKRKDFTLLHWKRPFNFAEECNFGANHSSGEYVIFLNNDTAILTPNWIEKMLQYAQMKYVGAVGCKLIYPDNTIQHAGIVLGMGMKNNEGVAGHFFKNFDDKTNNTIKVVYTNGVREVSGITAACLMIEKKKYMKVKEMDTTFKIAFNDVDLSIKLLKHGYVNVYNGFVKIMHYESASIGKPGEQQRDLELFHKEIDIMMNRWGKLLRNDHYYNPNLSLDKEGYNII